MSKWVIEIQANEDTLKRVTGLATTADAILHTLNGDVGISVTYLKKLSMVEELERYAEEYEQGKKLRNDSEVEIDVTDGKVILCDYSESRGSAETVRIICDADEISSTEIIELCNKHNWCHSI